MISEAFLRRKQELFERLKHGEVLTQELEHAIKDIYGGRGKRAIEAIKKRGVIKRGRRWFVRGKGEEYEVVKSFCTCRDYVFNISTEKAKVDLCYHTLAKVICELLDKYYRSEPETKSK